MIGNNININQFAADNDNVAINPMRAECAVDNIIKRIGIAETKPIVHAIIAIFESEGFIWGGRWWHYDTMHFEYRPEILCYARGLH